MNKKSKYEYFTEEKVIEASKDAKRIYNVLFKKYKPKSAHDIHLMFYILESTICTLIFENVDKENYDLILNELGKELHKMMTSKIKVMEM